MTGRSTIDRAGTDRAGIDRSGIDGIAARLLQEIGLRGYLSPLRDGREHHLYRITLPEGDLLLKFPRADGLPDPFDPARSSSDRLRGEAVAIQLAGGLSPAVPVPQPYVFYGHTSPPCAVMGMLPGTTPEVYHERGRLDYTGLMGVCVQMGRMLAAIHSRKRPADGGGLPDLPAGADGSGGDPGAPRLLHLDFHIGNVLGHPHLAWQLTGVVDWTCARWGPPEADIVEMQVSVFTANPRARDAFVAGYRQASGRVLDIRRVEELATREIHRRLREDAPAPEMQQLWRDWLSRKH